MGEVVLLPPHALERIERALDCPTCQSRVIVALIAAKREIVSLELRIRQLQNETLPRLGITRRGTTSSSWLSTGGLYLSASMRKALASRF